MKSLIVAFLTIFTMSLSAQILTYSDGKLNVEGEMVHTINIKLDPKPETVRNSFENWMDDKYDVDLDGKKLLFFEKEYMSAKGVVIPEVSSRKIDLMVKVDESKSNSTTLHVFASFGYNNWITTNEYPYEFAALEGIVYDYVSEYLPNYYLEKVEKTKDALEELSENRVDLKDDMKDNNEEIEKLKSENAELMKKLKENQKKISSTKSRLIQRNKDFKSINKRVKNK